MVVLFVLIAGHSESMTVAVPHNMLLITNYHLHTMNYVLKSHDLWRQSEEIEQKHCKSMDQILAECVGGLGDVFECIL